MKSVFAAALCCFAVGCSETVPPVSAPPVSETRPSRERPAVVSDDKTTADRNVEPTTETADRDNTAVNTRDRDDTAKTPIDQNENQPDINITAEIRKQVVATKMSVDAQNVKIITQDGTVTLRGPVKTEDEKKKIEEIAATVAGADKVDSQLEVSRD